MYCPASQLDTTQPHVSPSAHCGAQAVQVPFPRVIRAPFSDRRRQGARGAKRRKGRAAGRTLGVCAAGQHGERGQDATGACSTLHHPPPPARTPERDHQRVPDRGGQPDLHLRTCKGGPRCPHVPARACTTCGRVFADAVCRLRRRSLLEAGAPPPPSTTVSINPPPARGEMRSGGNFSLQLHSAACCPHATAGGRARRDGESGATPSGMMPRGQRPHRQPAS